MEWVDDIITGLKDMYEGLRLIDVIGALGIEIVRTNKNDGILLKQDALYVRCLNDLEIIFIRDDLEAMEPYVLAHELGHAILHPDLAEAYYSPLQNKGKLERQADYFAVRYLELEIDPLDYEGFSKEQLAKALYVKEEAIDFI